MNLYLKITISALALLLYTASPAFSGPIIHSSNGNYYQLGDSYKSWVPYSWAIAGCTGSAAGRNWSQATIDSYFTNTIGGISGTSSLVYYNFTLGTTQPWNDPAYPGCGFQYYNLDTFYTSLIFPVITPTAPPTSSTTSGVFAPSRGYNRSVDSSWGDSTFAPKQPAYTVNDPVNVATGYFVKEDDDLVVDGPIPIKVKRYYTSGFGPLGIFGAGTSFEYDWKLDFTTVSNGIRLTTPGQYVYDFMLQPSGEYTNSKDPEFSAATIKTVNGVVILSTRSGMQYKFEPSGGLIGVMDSYGNFLSIVRSHNASDPDATGVITSITNSEGKGVSIGVLRNGSSILISSVSDGVRTVSYSYSSDFKRLVSVQLADNRVEQFGYDAQGRMTSITDAKGIVTLTNEYDQYNRVTKQTLADGSSYLFSYLYNSNGGVIQTSMVSPNQSSTIWSLDNNGTITSILMPDGLIKYQIDAATRKIKSVTDQVGRTYTYNYFSTTDAKNGQVQSVTDTAGNVTRYDYDPVYGLPTSITNPQGKTVSTVYSFAGPAVTQTITSDPAGHALTVNYTSYGMPQTITDPNGDTVYINYDSAHPSLKTSVTDPLGNVTAYSYDLIGRMSSVTNANNNTTSYDYDSGDRVISVTDANGQSSTYSYDQNGNLSVLRDQKGNATVYQYDNRNRILSITDRLGKSETYSYYSGNEITSTSGTNLKSYTDKKGQTTKYSSYDSSDRVTLITLSDNTTIQRQYDKAGRLTGIIDNASSLSYTYNNMDRVLSELSRLPGTTMSYTYDSIGRRTSAKLNSNAPVTYSYDDDTGKLTGMASSLNGSQRAYSFGYDAAGRRTSVNIPLTSGSVASSYSFDGASRLISLVHQGPAAVLENMAANYDAIGNRTSTTRSMANPVTNPLSGASYDNEYEMLSYNGNNLTYDANGNLISKTDSTGKTTVYSWDARNRLKSVSAPGMSASFRYDALNRRISKTVNGSTTQYVYDGQDIIRETKDGVVTDCIRTLGVDEPLTKISGTTVRHYLRDGLGSVIGLVDDNGNPVSTITYDAYGNTSSTESFGFTGRENDGTGLMYYRARYYSPEMRRFISRDPLQFAAGSSNFYEYVQGNPVNYTDPSGEFINLPAAGAGLLIGGAVGAISSVVSGTDIWKGALIGGATGTAAGFTLGTSLIVNSAVGAVVAGVGDYGLQQWRGESIDWGSVGTSALIGGIGGGIGGAMAKGGSSVVDSAIWSGAISGGMSSGIAINQNMGTLRLGCGR